MRSTKQKRNLKRAMLFTWGWKHKGKDNYIPRRNIFGSGGSGSIMKKY